MADLTRKQFLASAAAHMPPRSSTRRETNPPPAGIPTLVFHGSRDTHVPAEDGMLYATSSFTELLPDEEPFRESLARGNP